MMHGREKSDFSIVASKLANKTGQPEAESVERREGTKGNTGEQHKRRTQSRESMSQELDRVRKAAQDKKKERFTALLHYVRVDRLMEAFSSLKREAVPGVDGATRQSYKQDLEVNLTRLHEQVHRGTYRALPSRRRYIPKPDGRQRPLGIAALEDKIVQRRGASAQFRLRGQLSGLFVWVPARTRPARCAGCVGGWDYQHEGELDRGRRHRRLLRRGQPCVVDPFRRTSGR